jgi:polar amino acid transport system substrate-binding protein
MSLRGRLSMLGVVAVIAAACSNGGAATAAPTTAPTAAPSTAPASAQASEAASVPASAPASAPASEPASAALPSIDPTSLLGKIIAAGKIRIATDPNYKPFSYLNPDTNQYEGFDTSTAQETVKRLNQKLGTNIQIEWQTPSWDLITAGSWGGRWDISIGSMSVTKTRAKVVDFTDPYYYDGGGIAVPKDSTITTLDQLNGGKTFCVGASTTYEQWLNGTLEIIDPNIMTAPTDPKVTSLPTDNECVQALAAGRKFDAIVANKNGLEDAVNSGQPIKMLLDKPIFTVSVAFALDKSGPDTASALQVLNSVIADMHADGTLKGFSEKWLGNDTTTAP